MSFFDGITQMPDALFDQTCSIEQGPTFATVSGMSALKCVVEPIRSNSKMMLFDIQNGATHIVSLQTHQPTIARGMRVRVGSELYPVVRAIHNDGQFTDLIVEGTSAKV